jgi:hypothetical protein
MIVFLVFCLAMFFVLYFTVGVALSDFNKRQSRLNKDYNYEGKYELVSAGSADKDYNEAFICIKGSYFEHEGEKIDANKYKLLVVDGNSMSRFGIKNSDIVFVDEYKDSFYKESPVLVLNVTPNGENKIKYKLRKAIDFYDCTELFDVWVKNHPELNAGELYEKYEKEHAKIEECKRSGCRLLVSETTKDGKPYYSFHPESRIYGKVKYKIPEETVKIIEKR